MVDNQRGRINKLSLVIIIRNIPFVKKVGSSMHKNQITVVYGENPREMVETLLTQLKPEAALRPGAMIGLKPNLVLDKPAASGATTHPEIVEGIIRYFQARGYKNLVI